MDTEKESTRQYVGQKGSEYADCLARAMVNACLYYGIPCPDPSSEEWEEVIEFSGCRHGAAGVSEEEMAEYFGLCAFPCDPAQVRGQVPVLLTVANPEAGHGLHAVLAIGWAGNIASVLDYRVEEGPLLERVRLAPFGEGPPSRPFEFQGETAMVPDRGVRWDAMYIPKPPNDRCFILRRPCVVHRPDVPDGYWLGELTGRGHGLCHVFPEYADEPHRLPHIAVCGASTGRGAELVTGNPTRRICGNCKTWLEKESTHDS